MSEAEVLESLETEIDQKRIELEKIKVELQEKEIELKKLPNREYSDEEIIITKKQITLSVEKQALKEKIEKQKAHDNQKVTGRFMNLRCKGQSIKLPYIKYPDDLVKLWEFEDGKVYTIPRGFCDQLNGEEENLPSHYIPRFIKNDEPMDPNKPQSQISNIDTSNKKYAFVPVGFN